ncbi:MAG: FAD binding domain-containing protein [Bacteroidota bacterium]
MIEFILNRQLIKIEEVKGGTSLLDFIRNEMHLTGTKSGCREGDCGACTVLVGEIRNDSLTYKTIVSCLTLLANVNAKHIVTIEGLNSEQISPVQQAIVENSATQCGFCTPGFVVSLTGYLLSPENKDVTDWISGNICRCTGYKSIERAADSIAGLKHSFGNDVGIKTMVQNGLLPNYFLTIKERLSEINPKNNHSFDSQIIAGATDLMIQKPDELHCSKLTSVKAKIPDRVEEHDDKILIGAGISINDFFENEILNRNFPGIKSFTPLIASKQIRNMGTIGGNIANASPIGDLSILLLALNASLSLEIPEKSNRNVKLSEFFLDYKKTDLAVNEWIKHIIIDISSQKPLLNFEKVSKRTYLDIASVNSAISINIHKNIISEIYLSIGGVAPFPKFMKQTCEYLKGKELSLKTLSSALVFLQGEIMPISDIRGSLEYKRLLSRQLFLMHFIKLFPHFFREEEIHELLITNTLPHGKH